MKKMGETILRLLKIELREKVTARRVNKGSAIGLNILESAASGKNVIFFIQHLYASTS